MRRLLTGLTALGLAVTLTACGSGGETDTQNQGDPTPTGAPEETADEETDDTGSGADATD